MVSEARILHNFAAISRFSLPGEGITRLAFSEEDWQARTFVMELMRRAGLEVRTDGFGNVFGRRWGTAPAAPVVICGSHIDSVPNGGNFDGVLGVLGAIEAVNMMNESGFENYNTLDIAVFMCEESSRFGAAALGSRAMLGELPVAEMKRLKDFSGYSLYDVLWGRGLDPDNADKNMYKEKLKACVEMHIEQGRVLETLHKSIGIVTGIAAPTRMRVSIIGRTDHSGATPMNMRSDALCAAAEIILAVEKTAAASDEPLVGTAGIIKAEPNVMNVIPGRAELGIDIRSIYAAVKNAAAEEIKKEIALIADKRAVRFSVEMMSDEQPAVLSPSVMDIIGEACEREAVSCHRMISGAGHDTMHLARIAPAGMIFIPCRGGISHNPAEWADKDDIVRGVGVLCRVLCRLSGKREL